MSFHSFDHISKIICKKNLFFCDFWFFNVLQKYNKRFSKIPGFFTFYMENLWKKQNNSVKLLFFYTVVYCISISTKLNVMGHVVTLYSGQCVIMVTCHQIGSSTVLGQKWNRKTIIKPNNSSKSETGNIKPFYVQMKLINLT